MDVPPRFPVLVGVGVGSPKDGDDALGVEAVELMARAVESAIADAGAPSLATAIEEIAVPQGTRSYGDPARIVAARIGSPPVRSVLVDLGIPQQSIVNDALRSILAGARDVVVVVGGEAKGYEARARHAGAVPAITDQDEVEPVEWRRPVRGELVAPAEIDARLVVPVEQYALMEQALRRALGRSIDEHRDEVARLWASFNEVAQRNPRAAFPSPRTAAFLREPAPDNRPLAFPYNKWHATQWTVDQAAALVLCSAAAARAHGIDPERWVFPVVGLESSAAVSLSLRRDLHRWPAMEVLGRAAAAHVGRPLREIEHAELYSCFPVAVEIQQRELQLAPDRVPTVTGGMAFAGGPFNNFVLQSTVAMVERLRADRRSLGLVTTVSGLLTKPGLAVWSTAAPDGEPFVADLAADAVAATPTVESVPGYRGSAEVATYTVTYDHGEPARVIAIGDTPDGRRCVAVADDRDLAARGTDEDLVGTDMNVDGPSFAGRAS